MGWSVSLYISFVVSHNGQILPETAASICRQIEQKLMAVDERIRRSKKQAVWKLWTRHISTTVNKTAIRNILHKITKMVNASNDQQRPASASIRCKDPFSSATPYAEELEYTIGLLIHDQDIHQYHFPELKILMKKKLIVVTRKANMYFNRLVPTK